MKLKDFMAAMQAIETDRKLSKEVVVDALQEALAKAFRKHIEIPDALVRVDVNEKSGDIKVYQQRLIVENVEDDELEISLEDAKRVNQELELGGVVEEEVSIADLGRAAVILAKNVMKQKSLWCMRNTAIRWRKWSWGRLNLSRRNSVLSISVRLLL